MKIVNINQVPKEHRSGPQQGVHHHYAESADAPSKKHNWELNPEASWVGSVTNQHIVDRLTGSDGLFLHQVNFPKGARVKFHAHTVEQVLIGTAGIGIVATEEGESVVKAGDVIYIPAGEKHWHGATKEFEFSHFSIFAGDHETTWLED